MAWPRCFRVGRLETITYSVNNTSTGNQFVGAVTVTVTAVTTGSIVGDEACTTAMYVTTPGAALGVIAPGATATGTATIKMIDDGKVQDNCEATNLGGKLTLGFSA